MNMMTKRNQMLLLAAAVGVAIVSGPPVAAYAQRAIMRPDARLSGGKAATAKVAEKEKKEDDDKDKVAVPVDKLPKAVVTGVKKEMPGARITKAAKIEKDNKVTFYLDNVKVGKKAWDVTVAEDGKIIKKEECHDDD